MMPTMKETDRWVNEAVHQVKTLRNSADEIAKDESLPGDVRQLAEKARAALHAALPSLRELSEAAEGSLSR